MAAAVIIAPVTGAGGPRGTVLYMRPSEWTGWVFLFVLGAIIYPFLYGGLFALLRHASIFTGTVLGALHAAVFVGAQLAAGKQPNSIRLTFVPYVAYGAVLGFLYVTP